MESSLNWAMEEKTLKVGLSLPIIGKLGIGNLYFNLSGTRVAMRSGCGKPGQCPYGLHRIQLA